MNDEINIGLKIDDANSAKTLGELKKGLRELVSLQGQVDSSSPNFKKLQKAINDTEGKLGDMQDGLKSLTGSGFSRVSSSLNLMQEGFSSFDTGKITTSLKGLTSALSAIPIFLIVEGITYLAENFDELSKGSGLLGKTLRVVGDILQWVVDKIYEFTDAIGLTNSALDKQGEALVTNAEKAKTALETQTKEYDHQINAAKAAGKSTIELEIGKQKAIIETNKALVEQTIAYVRAGGILNDEQNKLLTEQINAIKDAGAQINIFKITNDKKANDDYLKHLEEKKKLTDKDFEDYKKAYKEADDYRKKIDEDFRKWQRDESLRNRKILETKAEETKYFDDDITANFLANSAKKQEADRKEADAKKQQQKETLDQVNAYAQLTIATINGIAELQSQKRQNELAEYNSQKQSEIDAVNSNLEAELSKEGLTEDQKIALKNKAAQQEYQIKLQQYNQNVAIKKKEFENGKKQAIALALINGAIGVVAALSAVPFFPMAIIGMALATITTAFSVAKIASTKFDGGGAPPSPPKASMPSGGGSSGSSASGGGFKAAQFFGLGQNKATENINTDPQKVYVTEGDITKTQRKVEVIEDRSKIG